jgi:hypothetical protein
MKKMTQSEKNKFLLELYSLYEKSSLGMIPLEEIYQRKDVYDFSKKLIALCNDGLVECKYKLISGQDGQSQAIIEGDGVRFTEKGFDYLKELRKNKFLRFWEVFYKCIAPIGYLIDILWKIIAIFQRK